MALGVLTVVLPAALLLHLRGRRIVVHPDRVQVRRSGRVVRDLPFADLTAVEPVVEGSTGAATPEASNRAVVLRGVATDGRQRVLKVSELTVRSIDPLLLALAPEVDRHPALLPSKVHRELFAEYADGAGRDTPRG